MARTTFSGPVTSLNRETDGQILITPPDIYFVGAGTLTITRSAAGDIFHRRTAGDTAFFVAFPLSKNLWKKVGTDPNLTAGKPYRQDDGSARARGFRVTSFSLMHRTGTADLTSASFDINRTTFSHSSAPVVDTTVGGTITGSVTLTQDADPVIDTFSLSAPFIVGNNTTLVEDYIELSIDPAATSVWDLYGLWVNFDYNLL